MSGAPRSSRAVPANPWAEYERLKRQWQQKNPEASSTEYEKAIREIARVLGL